MTPFLTWFLSILSAIIIAAWTAWQVRHKTKSEVDKNVAETVRVKVETERFVVETLETALVQMRIERADDRALIEQNHKVINELKKENEQLHLANEECEFEHDITRIQLEKVLGKLQMFNWQKATVFVLDDDPQTVMIFRKRFERVPVVNFKDFVSPNLFLETVQKERPEIVIMDMVLDDVLTADQLISKFGYTPAIFIMSASKEYEVRFRGSDIYFFYKDRFFARHITKAILEHLKAINRAVI